MAADNARPIDRHALVTRHKVVLEKADAQTALQVGNGEFAFGVDVTGLQTFYGNTMSHWGWHSFPVPMGKRIEDRKLTNFDTHGRAVGYPTSSKGQEGIYRWLRENPHRFNLGRLALRLTTSDRKAATLKQIQHVRQELDLWRGQIVSQFTFDGKPVQVETCADPAAALHHRGRDATAGQGLPKIHVAQEHHGFADAAGKPFVPFGVTYYRPGTGWAPRLWKQFDAQATRRDFARLKRQGANVVRVFISFGSFFTEPGKLDPEGLAKFDQLLDLADEAGLYVHPTGPDHWEGMPAWTKNLNVFSNDANEPCLKALEDYWRMFARAIEGGARSGLMIFGMSRISPGIRHTCVTSGWPGARRATQDPLPVPDPKAQPPAPGLADYQRFRESVVERWVARQSQAIHAADPQALVTVGLLQWSVPCQRVKVDQYTGFRPSVIAQHLDFMELHFYPLAMGVYKYDGPASETANLAVVESMARECTSLGCPW